MLESSRSTTGEIIATIRRTALEKSDVFYLFFVYNTFITL